MKIKRIILILSIIFSSIGAEATYKYLHIHLMNDEITTFALEDNIELSFYNSYLWVRSSAVAPISILLEDIKKFSHSDSLDADDPELFEDAVPIFQIKQDELVFSNLKENAIITIYELNGNLILKKKIKIGGSYKCPLGDLKKGIYIVNVDGVIFKVLR